MKTIINKILVCLSSGIFLLGFASCSNNYMDKINKDNDDTHDAPAQFLLADVLTSNAVNDVGGDIDTYTSSYNEYEAGDFNQLWDTEYRIGTTSSTTFGNVWLTLYSDLKNERIIIEKCSQGGTQAGNYHTRGMAEVMAAMTSALITDNFGDVPYSQAALPDLVSGSPKYKNPILDSQKSVYDSITNYLNNAITDLSSSSTDDPGAYDYLYSGDASKWLKFAYGLKARYTLRLLDTYSDSEKATMLQSVLDDSKLSFTSNSDEAAYNMYNTSSNRNPYYDFFYSRDYFGASASYVNKLVARNDPRLHRIYINNDFDQSNGLAMEENVTPNNQNGNDDTIYTAVNGKVPQVQDQFSYSVYSFADTAPTMFMSYHELLFIEAEAEARLGNTTAAKQYLEEAIVAAMENTENNITAVVNCKAKISSDFGGAAISWNGSTPISDAQAEQYFTDHVSSLFDQDPLKEIAVQRYLAMFGANGESTEEYATIRRYMGNEEDYIELDNPYNSKNEYPWCLPYGSSDVTDNSNVTSAYGNGQYVYSNCIWWAKGTGKSGK